MLRFLRSFSAFIGEKRIKIFLFSSVKQSYLTFIMVLWEKLVKFSSIFSASAVHVLYLYRALLKNAAAEQG